MSRQPCNECISSVHFGALPSIPTRSACESDSSLLETREPSTAEGNKAVYFCSPPYRCIHDVRVTKSRRVHPVGVYRGRLCRRPGNIVSVMRMGYCAVRSLKISWAQILEPTNTHPPRRTHSYHLAKLLPNTPRPKVRHYCNAFVATYTLSFTNALAASCPLYARFTSPVSRR